MIAVRDAQIKEMAAGRRASFIDRMVVHLRTHFPKHSEKVDEPTARRVIEYGITQAAAYGIETERDVCKFITLMWAFGHNFDRNPALPWAAEILGNQIYLTGTERIEALYAAAKTRVRQAVSRSGEE